jgi:hypothetical protein
MKKILVIAMVLALVAAMVVPLAVGANAAGPVGYTTIGASIDATIEVGAPSDGSMGPMLVNKTTMNDSLVALKVYCNAPGWGLSASGSNGGYMTSATAGIGSLASAFNINGAEVSAYTPLTSSVTLVAADGTLTGAAGDSITVGGQQAVSYADKAASDYSIVITFTGTP